MNWWRNPLSRMLSNSIKWSHLTVPNCIKVLQDWLQNLSCAGFDFVISGHVWIKYCKTFPVVPTILILLESTMDNEQRGHDYERTDEDIWELGDKRKCVGTQKVLKKYGNHLKSSRILRIKKASWMGSKPTRSKCRVLQPPIEFG